MGSESSFIINCNTGEHYQLTDDNWKKHGWGNPVPLFQPYEAVASYAVSVAEKPRIQLCKSNRCGNAAAVDCARCLCRYHCCLLVGRCNRHYVRRWVGEKKGCRIRWLESICWYRDIGMSHIWRFVIEIKTCCQKCKSRIWSVLHTLRQWERFR